MNRALGIDLYRHYYPKNPPMAPEGIMMPTVYVIIPYKLPVSFKSIKQRPIQVRHYRYIKKTLR